MSKKYQHLTLILRSQISCLRARGFSLSQIALDLKIHKSTVSRELKRNSVNTQYSPEIAQNAGEQRRSKASSRPKALKESVLKLVKEKLHLQWSPEQISGWLKIRGILVSFAALYRYIRQDRNKGGGMYLNLRHRGKPYKKRPKSGAGVRHIPNRTGIDKRPESVDNKALVGDWEGDLIVGKGHKGFLLTYVDRCSKFIKIALLSFKEAQQVVKATKELLGKMKRKVKTITFDNGGEFAHHAQITQALGADVYFANPYSSWERGLNEHSNGLIRQYFPKGQDFTKVSKAQVKKVENLLNNRPRKVLGYKTPAEVFSAAS